MKTGPDITVTVIFHREGAFAVSALSSLSDLVIAARGTGITVETQAILDRADGLTKHVVDVRGRWIDTVEEVSFGDLGLSRNAGTRLAHGRFISFLDGDDLWGERWLRDAFSAAAVRTASQDIIWHPEHQYAFRDAEGDRMPEAAHALMQSSDTPGFDSITLAFTNVWSANVFATRELYARFPYCAVDRSRAIGIEDWSWNLATLAAGIQHRVVPGTVHLIRIKSSGSLDRQNAADQLLPLLPTSLTWGNNWP